MIVFGNETHQLMWDEKSGAPPVEKVDDPE